MSGTLTVRLENQIDEIQRMSVALEEFGRLQRLPEDVLMRVNLCAEELFNNIVSYGFEDSERHEIKMTFTVNERQLQIDIYDDGIAFDPVAQPYESSDSLEGTAVGGHGIQLVRRLVDCIEYQREGATNHLILVKRLHY